MIDRLLCVLDHAGFAILAGTLLLVGSVPVYYWP